MPLTDTIQSPELTRPRLELPEGLDPDRDAFFSILIWSLEQHGVRYCALHAHDGLLFGAAFAVHPGDKGKFPTVCADLKEAGYLPVQWMERDPGEYRVVFARVVDSKPETVEIDLVFGGRGGVTAEQIIRGARREGKFWACSSEAPDRRPGETPLRLRVGHWTRKLRRRVSPQGAFLVFLGPDGVGKTTLLRAVSTSLTAVFPEQIIYRWRPAVFARAPRLTCLPHSKPVRGTWGSISYLLFTCLDFASGYLLAVRPALSRNGLVIFDRYYHDLLIDPKRYRYAGPKWLVRALGRLVPPRDIFFVVLDADEQTILSRKQQLPPDEIRRQRVAYREFSVQAAGSTLITTDRVVDQCLADALEQIFGYLSARLAKENPSWFRFAKPGLDGKAVSQNRGQEQPSADAPVLQPVDSSDGERL